MTFPVPGQPLRFESLCDIEQGVGARLATLSGEVRALHREILLAFLTTGQPPHRNDLPPTDGLDRGDAFAQLTGLDIVQLDADGYVVVAYPFSGRPTGHTAQLDSPDNGTAPVLQAMCAIDALGIPLMTGLDGEISSSDPDDQQPIRVERRGDTWTWTPPDAAVLLAQSSGCGSAADLLCPTVTFHTSHQSAEEHLRTRPDLTGVVLEQTHALTVARQSFGTLLHPDPDTATTPPQTELRS
ncbi:organomercurial lyase [Pseudonocardia sp. GCM10023141]|uniref:organomercurial lyase n=1 Tax=Pseudonocardia sp. GCM10023141 TaxID=3252653 RepID=UPI003622AF57